MSPDNLSRSTIAELMNLGSTVTMYFMGFLKLSFWQRNFEFLA